MTESKRIYECCPLFADLSEEQLAEAKFITNCQLEKFERNEYIKRQGERLDTFGTVIKGCVQVNCDDYNGYHMIMANVLPGETFGESLCYLRIEESPVYITVSAKSEILTMSADFMYEAAETQLRLLLKERFCKMLAQRALHQNDRIQILSKNSVRAKIITLFTQTAYKCGSKKFKTPFGYSDMATYLGINRSSLFREIKKMEEEGLIEIKHTVITLKKSEE